MEDVIYFKSKESIIPNISQLTGVPEKDIDCFINTLENVNKGNRPQRTYYDLFVDKFNVSPAIKQAVYFHGTRNISDYEFSEGLLANSEALNTLWDTIWNTCKAELNFTDVEELRRDFEQSDYANQSAGYFDRIRGNRIRERGPWGKLVKEEWFLQNLGSNHYFNEGPELIRIILNYYSGNQNLHNVFRQNTCGCLVHYISDNFEEDDLGHGLSYLRDLRFCNNPHEFEGFYGLESEKGNSVPKERILHVEYI